MKEATTSIMLLLTLIFFTLFGHSHSLTTLNNNTDLFSLLSFKSQITLDPLGVLQSWNLSTPFCNWKGIICNITKQRVTSLNLENFGLGGTISPHISNISFLSDFNLQNNTFHGKIPGEIGKLFRLKSLNLRANQLEGMIPASISFCLKLVVVDLSDNRLEGTIPSELGYLSELQDLGLGGNFLTGEIPTSFGNLSSLVNFVVLKNNLQGTIPERLGYLPFLINLQLGENNFDGEIPKSLLNSSSLEVLVLAINSFSGHLPSNMFDKLTSLTILYAGGNWFSGPIPTSLGNASQLVRIDLSHNNFTGQVPWLGNLPNIEVLSLDTNELENEGKMDFFDSLANSTNLQVFSLGSNRLTGELPSSIGNLSRELSLFVMENNLLEGHVPEEISNLVGVTLLSLEYNSFTGNIPPSIGSMPNLQNIYIDDNKISGEIPKSLGNLTLLSEMHLQHNRLTGTIPPSLGHYQHIQILDLSHNMLSGKIPGEIFSSPSFGTLLDLSWNNLSGSVPQEIGKLKMIQGVDFSVNQLKGEIPVSIGDCSNLVYINISQNSFLGSIPKSLATLKGIEYIDFSSNNLSGEIPTYLESLRFLQTLDLSNNQLQGEVPKRGIFKNVTAVSLEGNPLLCGGNPQLKLPTCPVSVSRKHSGKSKVKLIIGLVSGLGAILSLPVILLLFLRKKRTKKSAIDDGFEVGGHTFLTLSELKIATRNFSEETLIGEGSFGRVYKGVLRDGTVAAIKVFKLGRHRASKTFLAECEALRRIRHRNLVKTISVCSTDNFKALVLQFMPNGSLEEWLHKCNGEEEMRLDMKQRLEIVRDVALAIEYLHHDCEPPVVHCDVKPSNVLLDEDMCAHVSDFGLARILLNNLNEQPVSSTLGLKGSIGYISPEYGIGGGVSTKGDVYSFGILILEMFTNKTPTDAIFSGEMDLQRWVSMGLSHQVMEIVDVRLMGKEWNSASDDCVIGVLELGLKCAAKSPEVRPSMREVSVMIKDVRTKLLI